MCLKSENIFFFLVMRILYAGKIIVLLQLQYVPGRHLVSISICHYMHTYAPFYLHIELFNIENSIVEVASS